MSAAVMCKRAAFTHVRPVTVASAVAWTSACRVAAAVVTRHACDAARSRTETAEACVGLQMTVVVCMWQFICTKGKTNKQTNTETLALPRGQQQTDAAVASSPDKMVKAYLRYEPAGTFGVISSGCNVLFDSSGRQLFSGALEGIATWSLRQGTQVCCEQGAGRDRGCIALCDGRANALCHAAGRSASAATVNARPPRLRIAAVPVQQLRARGPHAHRASLLPRRTCNRCRHWCLTRPAAAAAVAQRAARQQQRSRRSRCLLLPAARSWRQGMQTAR
jgi:hypothetical protein